MGIKLATAVGGLTLLLMFERRELLFSFAVIFFTSLKNKLFFISWSLAFVNRLAILITELFQLSQSIIIFEQSANAHTYIWFN